MANGEPESRPPTEDDSAEVLEEPAIDRLATLPSLLLTLVLPIEYPMRRPPILKTVHATNDWLPGSAVAPMVKRLQGLWGVDAEGSAALWTTCGWIRSGEFLMDIGLLKDGVIRIPHPAPALSLLLRRLAAHISLSLRNGLVVPSHCSPVVCEHEAHIQDPIPPLVACPARKLPRRT